MLSARVTPKIPATKDSIREGNSPPRVALFLAHARILARSAATAFARALAFVAAVLLAFALALPCIPSIPFRQPFAAPIAPALALGAPFLPTPFGND